MNEYGIVSILGKKKYPNTKSKNNFFKENWKMAKRFETEDVAALVNGLHYAQKVERSLELIRWAWNEYGDGLVLANSLGKDSVAVWHLAKRVSPKIRGFIITTRFKPAETKQFMREQVAKYPELRVFSNEEEIPDRLYETDPDKCCDILKVKPTRQAVKEMGVN